MKKTVAYCQKRKNCGLTKTVETNKYYVLTLTEKLDKNLEEHFKLRKEFEVLNYNLLERQKDYIRFSRESKTTPNKENNLQIKNLNNKVNSLQTQIDQINRTFQGTNKVVVATKNFLLNTAKNIEDLVSLINQIQLDQKKLKSYIDSKFTESLETEVKELNKKVEEQDNYIEDMLREFHKIKFYLTNPLYVEEHLV